MISTTPRSRTTNRAGGSPPTPLALLGMWLLRLRSSSEIRLFLLACVDNNPINGLMSVDSDCPGRNCGIVLRRSYSTYLRRTVSNLGQTAGTATVLVAQIYRRGSDCAAFSAPAGLSEDVFPSICSLQLTGRKARLWQKSIRGESYGWIAARPWQSLQCSIPRRTSIRRYGFSAGHFQRVWSAPRR